MLLTSPGDHGSSLPVDSLQPLQPLSPNSSLEGQSGIAGDRVVANASLETFVEGYHAPSQCQDESAMIGIRPQSNVSTALLGNHPAKAAHPGEQQPSRQPAWTKLPSQERDLDGLYALRQAATLRALRQSRTHSWSKRSLAALTAVSAAEAIDQFSFAAPLSPLRERDLVALSEFFQQDEMPAIEADIKQRLLLLLPEPCWEDEIFDFVKEFL